MALHPHQAVHGDLIINNRIFALFAITVNGTLSLVRYDSDMPCNIGVNFDLKLNGVSIYPTVPDRPAMGNGDTFVEQAQSVAVVKGDRVELSVTKVGSFSSVGSKLYANVYVQDGLPTTFGGTSATSFAIGTGSKAFTTQLGLAYTVGTRVRVSSSAAPTTNYMEGIVTAYSGTTITILVDLVGGSGTHTDWLLGITGDRGATGATGSTGSTGSPGADGVGVPVGGVTDQVLVKASNTDFDTEWADQTGGGGSTGGFDPSLYHEDFIDGSFGNTWIGITEIGGTVAQTRSEFNHPGIIELTTGASANSVAALVPVPNRSDGLIDPADMFDVVFLVRPHTNDSDTIYRIGLFPTDVDTFSDAVVFVKEIADTAFSGECILASTSTLTSPFVDYVADDWVRLRLRRIDASTIGFTVNAEAEQTVTTNIPTDLLTFGAHVITNTSVAKVLAVDFVEIYIRETGRNFLVSDGDNAIVAVPTITTSTIGNTAEETGSVAIARVFMLKKISVDKDSRVRLYKTAAQQTADTARTYGDLTGLDGTQHGILLDILLDGTTGHDWDFSHDVPCSNGDDPVTSTIYWSIQNLSGSSDTISVDLKAVSLIS